MTIDVMPNSPFFTSKCKAIWKENPVVHQKSLRAFFYAPLQLLLVDRHSFGLISLISPTV